jgi:hypothetical protein
MRWVLHYGSYCTSILNNLFDKRLSSVWLLKVFRTGSVAAEKMLAHKVEISKLLCAAIAVETEMEICLVLVTFAIGAVTTSRV